MEKKTVSRTGDMHPTRRVQIHQQSDGDVLISILQDGLVIEGKTFDERATVEFCVSGGRSIHTIQALRELAEAIEQDKIEKPISGE